MYKSTKVLKNISFFTDFNQFYQCLKLVGLRTRHKTTFYFSGLKFDLIFVWLCWVSSWVRFLCDVRLLLERINLLLKSGKHGPVIMRGTKFSRRDEISWVCQFHCIVTWNFVLSLHTYLMMMMMMIQIQLSLCLISNFNQIHLTNSIELVYFIPILCKHNDRI